MKTRRYFLIMISLVFLFLLGLSPACTVDKNRVKPGEFVIEPPTLISQGFEWHVEGDDNRNAAVKVSYRKKGEGDHAWKEALPLLRLQYEQAGEFVAPNMFAGSIFDLEPDTEYECRFIMSDPDGIRGKNDKLVTVCTRAEPMPFEGGRTLHVYPYGYEGPKEEPAFTGLNRAYAQVQPGDIILMHAGLIHVMAADGAFMQNGVFRVLPPPPVELLVELFRQAVLDFLYKEGLIAKDLQLRLLTWEHSGFSVHHDVKVKARDAASQQQLARYMMRAPFSLEKTKYKADSGMIVYRSKLHKGLKRNYQFMPGAQWLELLLQHVPDQGEHLVRYYGWYSNRSRGVRKQLAKKSDNPEVIVNEAPVDPAFSRAARAAWARLIQKVYEIDPLLCPHCGAEMRLMALIEASPVIEKILKHLNRWDPCPPSQAPPTADGDWPHHSQIPLTYAPLPDIA